MTAEGWRSFARTQGKGLSGYVSAHGAELLEHQQVIALTNEGALSLDAQSGEILWSYQWPVNDEVPITQPLVVDSSKIVVPAGRDLGSRLIELKHDGNWSATELWISNEFRPYFNDYVLRGGHAFGFDGAFFLLCRSCDWQSTLEEGPLWPRTSPVARRAGAAHRHQRDGGGCAPRSQPPYSFRTGKAFGIDRQDLESTGAFARPAFRSKRRSVGMRQDAGKGQPASVTQFQCKPIDADPQTGKHMPDCQNRIRIPPLRPSHQINWPASRRSGV